VRTARGSEALSRTCSLKRPVAPLYGASRSSSAVGVQKIQLVLLAEDYMSAFIHALSRKEKTLLHGEGDLGKCNKSYVTYHVVRLSRGR